MSFSTADIVEGTIEANGLTFATLSVGQGPLALCLHGFPDSAWTWKYLLPALADAGFHAVAPFLRGYAPTDVPADGLVQTGAHVADVLALHAALGGGGDAVLVGHDLGAIVAYPLLAANPGLFRRAVTIAVPPPTTVAKSFFTFDQLRRSWYVFFFQTPFPEVVIPLDDHRFIERIWQDWSPGYDGGEFVARAKAAIGSPEHLAAAVGWYRATLGSGPRDGELDALELAAAGPIGVPTMFLHGANDGCLGVDTLDDDLLSALPAEGSTMEVLQGVGHFLHLEDPERVNRLIVDFVSA